MKGQLPVLCRRLCSKNVNMNLNLIQHLDRQVLSPTLVQQHFHFQSRYLAWGSQVRLFHRPPQAVDLMVGLLSQHLHLDVIFLYLSLLSLGPVQGAKNKSIIIINLHTREWLFHAINLRKTVYVFELLHTVYMNSKQTFIFFQHLCPRGNKESNYW